MWDNRSRNPFTRDGMSRTTLAVLHNNMILGKLCFDNDFFNKLDKIAINRIKINKSFIFLTKIVIKLYFFLLKYVKIFVIKYHFP